MLYLTTEDVFENFGRGNCLVALPVIVGLQPRLVSVTSKQELQMSGISPKAINKTLLVFANFFTVNAHHIHGWRKDFFQRGTNSGFSRASRKYFFKGVKSGEISRYSLQTKKITSG